MRRAGSIICQALNTPSFGWLAVAVVLSAVGLAAFSFADQSPPTSKGAPPPKVDPQLNCPKDWLESIEDDAPVRGEKQNHDEYYAYNYFVMHAHKVPSDVLAKHARKEITFRRMFEKGRHQYRGEIVHVKGRLKRLNWIGDNKYLKDAGIKNLYEAWIFDPDYDNNPICVVLTELPPGLKTAEDIQKTWVACDGYFFKRYLYESAEVNEKTKQHVKRLAPLVIGRTLTVTEAPVSDAEKLSDLWNYFVPLLICSAFGMVAIAFFVHRWFAYGDRIAQVVLENAKATEFIAPTEETPSRHYPREPSAN